MATVVQLKPSKSKKATVATGRKPNAAYRKREYLTEAEIEAPRGCWPVPQPGVRPAARPARLPPCSAGLGAG
jgi:hypothetical protein